MVITDRTIEQFKDSFESTRSYDEIRQQQQQQIIGRRVLSTKKLLILPANCRSNYNMNFNEISQSSTLIIKKQNTNNDGYDLQQTKLKNIVINELKDIFVSQNQNYRQQDYNKNSETNISLQTSISTKEHPIQHKISSEQAITNKEQLNKVIISKTIYNSRWLSYIFSTATATLFTSIAILTNIFFSTNLIPSSKKFVTSF